MTALEASFSTYYVVMAFNLYFSILFVVAYYDRESYRMYETGNIVNPNVSGLNAFSLI